MSSMMHPPFPHADLQDVRRRVEALEAAPSMVSIAAVDPALADRVAALERRLDDEDAAWFILRVGRFETRWQWRPREA